MTADQLWPEQVLVGEIVYPPGGTLGPRIQFSLELVLLHSGTMTVWIDQQPHTAPAQTVSLLFPDHEERFAFDPNAETHHSFIHLWLPHLPATLQTRLEALPWPLPLTAGMSALMRQALALRQSPLSTRDLLLQAVGMQMLWRYLGEGERLLAGDAAPHPAVELAQQFIQAHLSKPVTLEDIAAAAAVSPSHLIRLFREAHDQTPVAYLWEQRVRLGIERLENTGLSVALIAQQCGFQTPHHFSRRVHQATGLSPLEVRRRAWGQT
jgi:AraC-like DNA-binding protein